MFRLRHLIYEIKRESVQRDQFKAAGDNEMYSQMKRRVLRAQMLLTGHQWINWNGEKYTPTAEEIGNVFIDLIYKVDASKEESYSVGTGGLYAFKLPYGIMAFYAPMGNMGVDY